MRELISKLMDLTNKYGDMETHIFVEGSGGNEFFIAEITKVGYDQYEEDGPTFAVIEAKYDTTSKVND